MVKNVDVGQAFSESCLIVVDKEINGIEVMTTATE